jgi:Cdc6-like AAA superfamily ATPase
MEPNDKFELMTQIARSFSPSAPIDRRVFAGRVPQITDVINACTQRGQHVVIFGERGAGKTSLDNALVHILGSKFVTPACGSINCDQTTTFASLWKAIFSEISTSKNSPAIGFKSGSNPEEGTLAQFLTDNVTPDAVRAILQKRDKLLIIIDEIDRIKDKTTTTLLADTIKSLSDHSVDTTVVLVGVADSVDALIAEHESVQRALIQVQMPRMSHVELDEIIDNGLQAVGMTIEQNAKQRINKLSQGLPHYTHLLALHSAQAAASEDRLNIIMEDTHQALQKALKHAQQSIADDYHRATVSSRETLYRQVLLACA